jgi:N-acyl-D-aspartate/D-glutamate deacylase
MAPIANFSKPNLDTVAELISHPDTLIGLGDGGAHLGLLCDASFPTTMLAYWARDREPADRITLPAAVNFLSRRNALAVGLTDRGLLAPGMKADVNVIDLDGLTLFPPEVRYDLPAGGRRVVQRARGYLATVVSGVVTRRDDEPTGATPGRLVRSGGAA